MNRSKWRKAGCKKCKHWHQGDKKKYPNGFCVMGGFYSQGGSIAIEKIKRCDKRLNK